MNLKVDTSEADAFATSLTAAIGELPSAMQRTVESTGGSYAKSHHKYKNRTYNLERSTGAYLTKSGPGSVEVVLTALAPYGQPVANLGYLDMDTPGGIAEQALDVLLGKLPE